VTVVGAEEQYVLHILSLCLALRVQHAVRMRRIIIWPAPLYSIFPHYLKKARFKKQVIEHKLYV